jgi:hypothetical protein
MKRTNIYLQDTQSTTLDQMSQIQGISKAELVRRLVDRGIDGIEKDTLDSDLAAISESFGAIATAAPVSSRGPDQRQRHLDLIRKQ